MDLQLIVIGAVAAELRTRRAPGPVMCYKVHDGHNADGLRILSRKRATLTNIPSSPTVSVVSLTNPQGSPFDGSL